MPKGRLCQLQRGTECGDSDATEAEPPEAGAPSPRGASAPRWFSPGRGTSPRESVKELTRARHFGTLDPGPSPCRCSGRCSGKGAGQPSLSTGSGGRCAGERSFPMPLGGPPRDKEAARPAPVAPVPRSYRQRQCECSNMPALVSGPHTQTREASRGSALAIPAAMRAEPLGGDTHTGSGVDVDGIAFYSSNLVSRIS
jgi:hypothetical protein